MAGREGDYVKNLPNDTKKELKSPRNIESKHQKNAIICIVGTVIFAILTILFPLLKVFGGFLTFSDNILGSTILMDFYWDQISVLNYRRKIINYTYLEYSQYESSPELIWRIIHLWGPIFIILGIIGAGLVVLPAFQKLQGHKTADVAKVGLIIGLVATGVEFGLFLILWIFSTNTGMLNNATNLTINFFLLGCFVIGWIALIVGSVFAPKN